MTARAADRRVDGLRLARAESVGAGTYAALISRYGDPGRALEALPGLAGKAGRIAAPVIPSLEEAHREISDGEALGARLVFCDEPEFPPLLRALDPPPPLIWVLGDAALLRRPCVALVGSRNASAAGRTLGRTLSGDLGDAGWVVVSGLARGIDAAAHQGALETGTIAVMAGGVNAVYPPENQPLYDAIVSRGCVISERAMGHVARAQDFPRRNRLISGLSRGVVVVEAELRSGSLITARLAGEQGREVFAVPGSPLDPRARGANDLIRQGAVLVEEAQDVLRVLDDLPPIDMAASRVSSPRLRVVEAARAPAPIPMAAETDDLGEGLAGLLSKAPISLDQLARATGAPLPAVLAALMELSLAGRAELMPGGLAVRA